MEKSEEPDDKPKSCPFAAMGGLGGAGGVCCKQRTRNTATRVEKRCAGRDGGERGNQPLPRERRRWLGHEPAPHPSRRQDIGSPPHKALPQPSPIQGQQNIEPRFPHQSIPALSHPLILYTTATSRGIPKIQTQYPFYSQYATSVRFLDKITDAPQPTRGFLVLFVSLVILLVLAVFLCVLDTPYAAKVSRCNPFMLSQTHLAQSTAPSGGWYLFPTCRLLLHDVPLTQPG